jgi:nicotinamidase-related amidase
MSAHLSLQRKWPRLSLVCLDLQREFVVPGRPLFQPGAAAVVETCSQLVRRARRDRWRILHAHRSRAEGLFGKTGLFAAPIEGLRPLISEPIFVRAELSAFANLDFRAALRQARGDIYLIGFSLADSCLATAFDAVDEGLRIHLVADALGAERGAAAVTDIMAVLGPMARLVSSRELCARAPEAVQ